MNPYGAETGIYIFRESKVIPWLLMPLPHASPMILSSNGNNFRITNPLWGESTNSQIKVSSHHKGQWPRALIFSSICAWINGCPCNPLQWRHKERDGLSNHRNLDCLPKRLFRRWLKKTSKLRVTGLCEGNSRWPLNSPHKRPVTRKMFPFDGVIMWDAGDLIRHRAHYDVTVMASPSAPNATDYVG